MKDEEKIGQLSTENIDYSPFSDSHSEKVDVLIERVEEGDRLDNHVVHTVNIELDL